MNTINKQRAPLDRILAILFEPSHLKRFLFFLISDILIVVVSLYLSFLLRFDFRITDEYWRMFLKALPIFLAVKLAAFFFFKLYRIVWSFVGLNEIFNISNSIIVSEAILLISFLLITAPASAQIPNVIFTLFFKHLSFAIGFPRSIFIIDGILSVLLLSGLRISKRLVNEIVRKRRYSKTSKRTIIVGAGHTGETVLREMARQHYSEYYPLGFLDDANIKQGTYLQGVKVLGTTDQLSEMVKSSGVEVVIIAIPSLNFKTLRTIYNAAKDAKVPKIKIVPRIYDFHRPEIQLKNFEDIQIEDLIGRQVVEINYSEIEKFLMNQVILISGAGGSIGSELATQACGFNPGKVILFDIDETELHTMELKLKKIFPDLTDKITYIAGDVRDEGRLEEVFREYAPKVVFHAAAYKHVPMMEHNPKEAVKVNIFGTRNIAKVSLKYGVHKFIMISTDKAVRPTSVMGATKRIAEYICRAYNTENATEFISVRFGNVLGSRGSVLPLFMEQLRHGGPLTVTHKDMQRYFMTIPEAVSLVLQASAIGKGGDILVLDMGEPVKIVNLAEELIRIHGLEPYRDIGLEFTGLRPGEKLFEEILTAEEGTSATMHQRIYIANHADEHSKNDVDIMLGEFHQLLENPGLSNETSAKELLKKHVKHYHEQ